MKMPVKIAILLILAVIAAVFILTFLRCTNCGAKEAGRVTTGVMEINSLCPQYISADPLCSDVGIARSKMNPEGVQRLIASCKGLSIASCNEADATACIRNCCVACPKGVK